jgi:hypothetical protein
MVPEDMGSVAWDIPNATKARRSKFCAVFYDDSETDGAWQHDVGPDV